MSVQVKSLSGSMVAFNEERLAELRGTFRGAVLTPLDDGYEQARKVENLHIDRRPGLIVRCSGTADVIDAVNLAREQKLLVAVRSGGHSVAGHSTTDGGLVIDLSSLRGVWVNPQQKLVRAQGGATWGDVDRETQAFGLAVPGGAISTTGVAGLTLGGGIGWLHHTWGLSCDNLTAVEMVTANGELVRASADENPELFWGVRGGGGNFGVVVSLEFAARKLGPVVMAALAMYPADAGPKAMRAWRDWAAQAPETITTRCLFWTMPASPALPPAVHNRDVFIVGALHAGDPVEGERLTQPIRELDRALADLSGQVQYRHFNSAMDALTKGLHGYWKSTCLKELNDTTIDFICERSLNRPDPNVVVHVPRLGGAISRVAAGDTAFGDRSAAWMLSADGNWTDPRKADEVIKWTRQFVADADKLLGSGGTYLNFSAEDGSDKGNTQAQFGKNWDRLTALKKKYDPDNLFRLNNNIPPQ
jgi:FAD/FMN-containing dehydrogenase